MNLKFNFAKNYFFRSFGVLFLIVISICFANGQSKDIKNPTSLTSNEISGSIDKETRGNTFYYSFWANPGEVKVLFSIEQDPNFTNVLLSSEFFLYDSDSKLLANKTAAIALNVSKTNEVTAKIQNSKRQVFILGIKLHDNKHFENVGKYKILVEGADTNAKEKSQANSLAAMLSAPKITFPIDGLFICSLKNQSASFSLSLNLIQGIYIYDYPKNQLLTSELNYGKLALPNSGKLSISLKTGIGVFAYDMGQISECEILGK
jgi:hypothetical protein